MNILLVDYDTDSRAGIAEFLREMEHHVTEHSDVEEAYTAYITGAFSMVLVNIKMPAVLGGNLLHRIMSLPGEEAEVVLFTNYNDRGVAVERLHQGAYAYLLKPINVIELAAVTDRIVAHQALLRESKEIVECAW